MQIRLHGEIDAKFSIPTKERVKPRGK